MELNDTPKVFRQKVADMTRMCGAKLVLLTGNEEKCDAVLIDHVGIVYIIEAIASAGEYAPGVSMVTMLREQVQAALEVNHGKG